MSARAKDLESYNDFNDYGNCNCTLRDVEVRQTRSWQSGQNVFARRKEGCINTEPLLVNELMRWRPQSLIRIHFECQKGFDVPFFVCIIRIEHHKTLNKNQHF